MEASEYSADNLPPASVVSNWNRETLFEFLDQDAPWSKDDRQAFWNSQITGSDFLGYDIDRLNRIVQRGIARYLFHLVIEKINNQDTTPNWKDAQSILQWIQKYRRPEGVERSRLVSAFGSALPFLRRDDTLDTLWNGSDDRNGVLRRFANFRSGETDKAEHPIPFLACGPGTGKSRFLQEVGGILRDKARSVGGDIAGSFAKMLCVNITYGNGTPASQTDVTIGGEASIASRLLYEHFIGVAHGLTSKTKLKDIQKTRGIKDLDLDTAIDVIRRDLPEHQSSGPYILVLGIDEISQLHQVSNFTLRMLVRAVGGISCDNGYPFFIPILAGTIQDAMEKLVQDSTYLLLNLPLPLLSDDDVVEIGGFPLGRPKFLSGLPERYRKDNPLFRRCVSDIGGVPRAVEIFYRLFWNKISEGENVPREEADLKEYLECVNIVAVEDAVLSDLKKRYPFKRHLGYATIALAKSILNIPVGEDETITVGDSSIMYKELRSAGILNLQQCEKKYLVRIPYLWTIALVDAANVTNPQNSSWRFWTMFVDPTADISWERFEVFVMQFWALRISLYSYLGWRTIRLAELLRGAELSSEFPDIEVQIPDYKDITVHELMGQFPHVLTEEDRQGNVLTDIHEQYNRVFVNGRSGPVDGHWICRVRDGPNLFVGFQMKLAEEHNSKSLSNVTSQLIEDETDNIITTATRLNQGNRENQIAFALISNRHRSRNLAIPEIKYDDKNGEKKRIYTAVVHRENFEEFFGYTFAGRAQFSVSTLVLINSAPKRILQHIPGIGDKIAQQIVDKREQKPFSDIQDLKTRVPKFPVTELSSIIT